MQIDSFDFVGDYTSFDALPGDLRAWALQPESVLSGAGEREWRCLEPNYNCFSGKPPLLNTSSTVHVPDALLEQIDGLGQSHRLISLYKVLTRLDGSAYYVGEDEPTGIVLWGLVKKDGVRK